MLVLPSHTATVLEVFFNFKFKNSNLVQGSPKGENPIMIQTCLLLLVLCLSYRTKKTYRHLHPESFKTPIPRVLLITK